MLFKPDMLPDGISIARGQVHDDGRISPILRLNVSPDMTPGVLEFEFWNPDCFLEMVDNSILVRLVDQTNYVENIQLNQLVEISVSLIGPIPTEEAIGFQVFKYLDRSKHDDRQRALKLVRCEWHQA